MQIRVGTSTLAWRVERTNGPQNTIVKIVTAITVQSRRTIVLSMVGESSLYK